MNAEQGQKSWRVGLVVIGLIGAVLGPDVAGADGQVDTSISFVPNVVEQFNALTSRPDPMGFDIGGTTDPLVCKHYQGMARVQGPDDTPYLFISKSGNETAPCVWHDDSVGSLVIVRMGSRDQHGERMRSNRLRKGSAQEDTAPEVGDIAIRQIFFDGVGDWPRYGHPEGMQLLGNILVMGVDTPMAPETQKMQVLFLDVSDPENPVVINRFKPEDPELNGGVIAITPLPDGRYLLMITGASRSEFPIDVFNEKIWFFESRPTPATLGAPCHTAPAEGRTDLANEACLAWDLVTTWESWAGCDWQEGPGGIQVCINRMSPDEIELGQNWPSLTGRTHQMFNFIREGSLDGELYLAGARGGIDIGTARIGDDILDLYRVRKEGGRWKLRHIATRQKDSRTPGDPDELPSILTKGETNFAAASGFYVSPSGELIFYATEHQNGGPKNAAGVRTVRFGEWRHREMVRPESPTYLPWVRLLNKPYVVPEGSSTTLVGLGEHPVTQAWIQLYAHKGLGGRYFVIDFPDWHKDDFDDFIQLEGGYLDLHRGFNDEASSARWFAPDGCSIRLNEHQAGPDSGSFVMLAGSGVPDGRNLDQFSPDLEDELTSVEFADDCYDYYDNFKILGPFVFWDTNNDGHYETQGEIVPFLATDLDGPGKVDVPVLAAHYGLFGHAVATVEVLNVAPRIDAWSLVDSLGQELGAQVPFFLERVPVTVAAWFTDPGKPDRQTALIAWGDGVIDESSTFDAFSDAFGGEVGYLRHVHRYDLAGDYPLVLSVTDDDGGETSASTNVPVFSVVQALDYVIERLQWHVRHANNKTRKPLADALKALEGSKPPLSQNGAREKLNNPDVQAALTKLRQAIDYLHTAQAAGADVGMLIMLLEQVVASLLA